MARTFPAVIVKGILESGKTTFIVDSLKNGDFGDVGREITVLQKNQVTSAEC